jgi:hypothetical protein
MRGRWRARTWPVCCSPEARRLVARGLERMEALAQAHPLTPYEQQVRAWLEALELVQN